MDSQVVSKERVADHGEVYTNEREVNAMLNLVQAETERIDSRFLEPACGTGNFLAEILARKLRVVEERYKRSQLDWERNAVLAVSSVYGIDILHDNVIECRRRLLEVFDALYTARFKTNAKNECRRAARFILEQNIAWGDALTFKTVDANNPVGARPLVLAEWSFVSASLIKRRDFMFSFLVEQEHQFQLFNDQGEMAHLPLPVNEYPPTHFLKVADEQETENEKTENPKPESGHCSKQNAGRDAELRLEF